MGIPSDPTTASPLIPSPEEERRIANARRRSEEAVRAGAKAAAVAAVVAAVPTLISVRVFPWAKARLNYPAQAFIISAASIATYFITADKYILESARKTSLSDYEKTR